MFFAMPLIVQDVDESVRESIHAKVHAFLNSERAKETIRPSPEESVATSYYRSDASILKDAGLHELEELVLARAKAYLEKTLKLPPRKIEVEQAWINIFEPGAQEGQHSHDGSLLSCSYYVEAPKDCGCIVFPDPIGARRSYREFTRTAGPGMLNRRDMAVEPQPGRFVMFESWTPHYIQCNKSDKVRISIAINLRGAPEEAPAQAPREPAEPARVETPATETGTAAKAERKSGNRDGRPFLFNDLFDVNQNASVILKPIADSIPVVMIDDFLADPETVREVIGATPATNWKLEPGSRNFVDYYDCRLRFPIRYPNKLISAAQEAIRQIYRVNTRPADASVDVNWFMQINPRRADFAVPHADITENINQSFTCVLYLNRLEECLGGTGFYRFKGSDSLVFDEGYVQAVQKNPAISETGLDYWPESALDVWEQVGTIDMLPGRLMIFPSQYFHSAWHPEDSFFEFPRLTLAYWMIN